MADLSASARSSRTWTLADFDFELPEALIAQRPAADRSVSRLLDLRGDDPVDRVFRDLPALLDPGDLLVFNDTQVIKARLLGRKASGGAVEALVERVASPPAGGGVGGGAGGGGPGARDDHRVWCHLRTSKSPAPGARIRLGTDRPDGGFDAEVLDRAGPDRSLFELRFPAEPLGLLERYGHMPLPPYLERGRHATDDAQDERRYQTVFASRPGAVAAPTAALHFDEALLAALAGRGVRTARLTLHVGAGTFQPVRSENIVEHRMHREWFEVPPETVDAVESCRAARRRVVAVGTTTLRALESAARDVAPGAPLVAGARDTEIFITPGFDFRVVDRLITNFHLPKSTLLMLVSAFAGHEHIMAAYRHAIAQRYRFFSYGDAMLLARA